MKNFLVITVLFWLCTVSGAHGFAEQPSPYNYITPKCPKVADLMETSSKDKEELLKALKDIVPEVYGDVGYDVWVVKEANALPLLVGFDEVYYRMAINRCGEDVGEKSWIVKLQFPKFLPSGSASSGIFFVTKSKEKGWIPWYMYK
ncbi:hypothetical protein SAMN04487897_101936 [Paenibacillus sp. yr247]|uniref:hypothetical protein n=1 Tax=Paenibacillus sp. yr247 TaxID=1761880 RepID=UPI00088F0DE9|nr:hypothetical protein [Paenibacillus sp. yr247]SDN05894.1 hypothetical protein SAMN04487897_101936 [Paenibacillus sp. yr247]